MTKKLTIPVLSLLLAATALTAHAETNLLQSLTMAATVFSQGTPVVTDSGTNNVVNKALFTTKDLIRILSTSGTYQNGDTLVRVVTVTNTTDSTNPLGSSAWMIYNAKTTPVLTPINTNVYFDVHTHVVFDDGTNLALIHGESITRNGVIHFGTRDEFRTLVLSNSVWQIKLDGYAHGHLVPVSLDGKGGDVVYSADYPEWNADGSGTMNSNILVLNGQASENYFKLLK
jgi:hypothetical protein